MNLNDFDYNLPKERIAIYPPKIRGTSKLLHLNKSSGIIEHLKYKNLVDLINPGDVLILNDTKVLKARIILNELNLEIFLLEKHKIKEENIFYILNNKKLKNKSKIVSGKLEINILEDLDNGVLKVSSNKDLYKISHELGQTPIPPYLKRESENLDNERYQTVFAKNDGSVAAPTASLNFTEEIRSELLKKGVIIKYVTLHVGLGTFQPIKIDDLSKHKMHKEYFFIPKETVLAIQSAKRESRNVIALGTTATRALESSAQMFDILKAQDYLEGEAEIFIYPGYTFQIIDKLITNFHAPKSTVLMLTAAFAQWNNLKKAYESALASDYKFLSYGDSMFIE